MIVPVLISLVSSAIASPPPETCDIELINECLANFETRFLSCEENDIHCQCGSVIKDGANCYAACPQEALTKFIQTYNDGKCANYDPYISKREVDPLSEVVKAITITPSDPTTTISLSPQEYQSRLEKEKYRENLRSVRKERARISKEALEARDRQTIEAVNRQATKEITSTKTTTASPVSTKATTSEKKAETGHKKEKNGSSQLFFSIPLLVCVAVIAVFV